MLLHEAVDEALQLPESAIKMAEFPAEWAKMQADTRPVNQQRLRREYEVTYIYNIYKIFKLYGSPHEKYKYLHMKSNVDASDTLIQMQHGIRRCYIHNKVSYTC